MMALIDYIQQNQSNIGTDVIEMLSNNGRHILKSGKVAMGLTDERLKIGDRVLIISDKRGNFYILAGGK